MGLATCDIHREEEYQMFKGLMDLLRKRYQNARGCCGFEEQTQQEERSQCCDLSKKMEKPGNPVQ